MAFPLLSFGGAAISTITNIAAAAFLLSELDRIFGEDEELSPPSPQGLPYTPPFTGGQCLTTYNVFFTGRVVRRLQEEPNGLPVEVAFGLPLGTPIAVQGVQGAIASCRGVIDPPDAVNPYFVSVQVVGTNGTSRLDFGGFGYPSARFIDLAFDVRRADGLPDNCGNLPNPNDPIPVSDGGGELPEIELDNPIEIREALYLPIIGDAFGAIAALLAALGTVADVLDGIKLIGDILNEIRKIIEEGEKDKPKNRGFYLGEWFALPEDGGFLTLPQSFEGKLYSPYALQIEIESFPSTASRRLGINSPNFAHLEPLGYIMLRGVSGGYGDLIPIRFLRNEIALSEFNLGVSFSFRENPQIRAKCRIWYSAPP